MNQNISFFWAETLFCESNNTIENNQIEFKTRSQGSQHFHTYTKEYRFTATTCIIKSHLYLTLLYLQYFVLSVLFWRSYVQKKKNCTTNYQDLELIMSRKLLYFSHECLTHWGYRIFLFYGNAQSLHTSTQKVTKLRSSSYKRTASSLCSLKYSNASH